MTKTKQPKPSPSYEELRTELDTILTELQSNELDIDQALKQYERGREVIKQLEAYLETAENQIKVLQAKFGDTAA